MVSKDPDKLDILNSYLCEEACELVNENVFNLIGLLNSDRETDGVDTWL